MLMIMKLKERLNYVGVKAQEKQSDILQTITDYRSIILMLDVCRGLINTEAKKIYRLKNFGSMTGGFIVLIVERKYLTGTEKKRDVAYYALIA